MIQSLCRRLAGRISRPTHKPTACLTYTVAGCREGWEVAPMHCPLTGFPRHELRSLKRLPDGDLSPLQSDHEAWQHVVDRARVGSPPHRAALRMLDPVERRLIETHCGPWSDPTA